MTELGKLGVWWALLGSQDAKTERAAAQEIERLGYSTLWYGESVRNKDAFAHAAILLGATERINVASGIASIYNRDATATKSGAYALADAFDGRFVLGLGVSHAPAVERRGRDYGKPVTTMRNYLDEYDAAEYQPPAPTVTPLRLCSPRCAATCCGSPPSAPRARIPTSRRRRTRPARARSWGRARCWRPSRASSIESDPAKARAAARAHLSYYLVLPNYVNSWREDGYGDEDFADGGSDRLVDALVAWGDADAVKARIAAHHDAGADHVCIQPVTTDLERGLSELAQLRG